MPQLPEKMTVIAITAPGGPDVLGPEERYVPVALGREILIKVEAAGVNRPDVMQRMGLYPPPKDASDLPGLEVAGTVVASGSDASRYQVGDKVTALAPGGGYAEYCKVDERHALPIPEGLSMVEAAALPETFFTVWSNVFDRLGLKPGENFLVHGGTSGIGTTAIQLAKAFGAVVFTTVGSDEKLEAVKALGADHAVNYNKLDFVETFLEATNTVGIHAILDMVGGDYVEKNWKVAAVEGRICQIATLNGTSQEVNFSRLMMKRLTHTGSTLRPRDAAFKAEIASTLEAKVWPLIAQGKAKPLIDSTYPLAQAAEAHRRMESSGHIGKIVLTIGDTANTEM
ncbi:NAD(P)H-quinone oxidoreductase [Roseibium sp. CAU 1637]|uniref:NAD(P)H-quinone oxidoreductase n=1 Tax=Roseibium limicola TaxID=2816037 RepID=A0A939ERU5_9HYPH|nr:NAD(P)H-quinone oxidoreductase [Roseibium limicola]MBO0346937.1 NAD(P)H-quinone oxidoreductase [Roseibium limicola]